MNQDPVVIVAARRTPIGSFQGQLAPLNAVQLSAVASQAALADAGLPPSAIDEALIGCVLPAALGQAPARQAVLAAGLPQSVGATTINKVCGSGLKAAMLGHDLILAGSASVVLAGGMESMSNAPYMLPKARSGYRMGHQDVLDHMFFDGLQNPYDGNMMGHFADATATKYGLTREMQDEYAIKSVNRALAAAQNGSFADEIAPVTVKSRGTETLVDRDEEPDRCELDKIPTLRPAFDKEGTVTAASSSSISDGAASLILMRASAADKHGIEPLAFVIGHSGHSHEPEWFTTAPVQAVRNLQDQIDWNSDDVDLYEINEAFACVAMAAIEDLNIDSDRLNVNGGACALGHPIGATGARIITTLVNALRNRGLKRGIAAVCIGGGEAVAVAVESA